MEFFTQEIMDLFNQVALPGTEDVEPQKERRGLCENDECDEVKDIVIRDWQKICLECGTVQRSYFPGAPSANHHLTHTKPSTVMHDRSKYFRECMDINNIHDNYGLEWDFKALENVWFDHGAQRTNFLNYNYILYQLLRRHNVKPPSSIKMLKSVDRTIAHDVICEQLFNRLGWKFIPVHVL